MYAPNGDDACVLLYIIRHGESERNRDREGPYDCPLTEAGLRQAELTGAWLRGKGIAHLYCSPAIRTCETALAIGRAIGVAPRPWAELVEWGYFFEEPGLTGAELAARFPEIPFGEEFPKDRGWAAERTEESWEELFSRAEFVRDELLRRHAPGDAPVALVTHAHFARHLLAVLLGLSAHDAWSGRVDIYNCSVTCFEFRGETGAPVLCYANAHGHLGASATYHP